MPMLIATVEGVDYGVDLEAITGEQVVRLRLDLGVSPADLIARIDSETAELPEIVALMVLALEQADEPADHRWLLRHIDLTTEVELSLVVDDEPAAEPAA